MCITEMVEKAQISFFLKLKIHPKRPGESIKRDIVLHIPGVKQLGSENLNM